MNCIICGKDKIYRREYCGNCYQNGRKNGTIEVKKDIVKELTELQKEVLIGSLLGDGSISQPKITHAPIFKIARSAKDEEYLLWEMNVFKNLINKSGLRKRQSYLKITDKFYDRSEFQTLSSDVFLKYRKDWYPEGKKIIPKNFDLTPIILAVWFCDDGHIDFSINKNHPRMKMDFATHCFSIDDVEYIGSKLENFINEKISYGVVKHKTQSYIICNDNATRAIISKIDNYFPEGMNRKRIWDKPEARYYENIPERSTVNNKNKSIKDYDNIDKYILYGIINNKSIKEISNELSMLMVTIAKRVINLIELKIIYHERYSQKYTLTNFGMEIMELLSIGDE